MDFTFVSGDVALDLAGTVGHRRTDRYDLLSTLADLARWTVAAHLLDEPPPVSPTAHTRALELREAIYRLATRTATGTDRALVNRAAEIPPVRVRLDPTGALERAGDLDAALATVARAAVELLGGPHAGRISECQDTECTRLYVDASRRGGRRWCDMRQCGNRAKAATFRTRHRPT